MVQVLAPVERRPSFLQQLSAGVGRGLEAGQQLYSQHQQQKAMQQAGFGDLAGLSPELQKVAIAERLRQQGKERLLGQKEEFLNKVLGGEQIARGAGGISEEEFKAMSPGRQALDVASIPDEVIAQASAIDPNIGRSLQHAKDVALREKREAQKLEFSREKFEEQKRKAAPSFKREEAITTAQAAQDVKFNQQLQEQERQGKLKSQSLENLARLNQKGVTGKPYEKFLEKAGLTALTSEGRREFAADVKNLITDIRSILGGQFSQFEFQTILNAYPSADFSKEANSAIIKNLMNFQDIKNKEVQFARDIKKENDGRIPEDFQSLVNERVSNYAQSKISEIKENVQKVLQDEYSIPKGHILLFDPNGEPLSVPENELGRYLDLGAVFP